MDLRPTLPAARRWAVRAMQSVGVNKVAHRVYYSYVHGFDTASHSLAPALERCFSHLADSGVAPTGDYLEFGVFKGYSFWHAQQVASHLHLDGMRFYGFDSFAGLPPPEGVDRTYRGDFYEGQYTCSKAMVERNLNERGVDWSRTFLIEGFFAESLTPELRAQHRLERAAIVLIDCDLYESTRQVLEFLEPLLDRGTILIFDDWNAFDGDDRRGERRALGEFLARHHEMAIEPLFSYGHYGQVFSVTAPPGPFEANRH
jgi:O-methyltransferase